MPTLKSVSEKILAELAAPERGNIVYWAGGVKLQGSTAPAGFGVRVTASGALSFVLNHRIGDGGRLHRETIGSWEKNEGGGELSLLAAILAAKARAKELVTGVDKDGEKVDVRPERTRRMETVAKPKALTINEMFDQFETKYLDEKELRSGKLYKGAFKNHVRPEIGNYSVYDIKRSHIVSMLDDVADEVGTAAADRTLAYFRKACNWFCTRDDEFISPIVKGMMRNANGARTRVLDDAEIRDLWHALERVEVRDWGKLARGEASTTYARYVRALFLTATRRTEAADMHSREIDGDLWTIPADRYKTKIDHVVPLTPAVLDLIGGKPDGCESNGWFVFTTNHGSTGFSGFSKAKIALDKALAAVRAERGEMEPMPEWRLHDLRRTARTLMSRAKIDADIAERCIGHKLMGVRGVYDRFEFLDEKRDAFERLAKLVNLILNPPQGNVVPIREVS